MESKNTNKNQVNEFNDEISFAELFFHYFHYWKLFLLSLIVCLGLAYLYLRYTTPEYKVVSKVVINDDKKGQTGVDMTAFSDLGIISQNSNIDNEIEVLRSHTLMKVTTDSLKLGVSYFKKGKIRDLEIYKNTPVKISVNQFLRNGAFSIEKDAQGKLSIHSEDMDFHKQITPGKEFSSPWGFLTVSFNPWGTVDYPIWVVVNDPDIFPSIQVNSVNKTSSIVELTTTTPCPEKGRDIINTLVDIYNQQTIDEKNYVANNTNHFIDERLGIISGELETAEKDVESYKIEKGLTDIKAEGELFLATSSDYDKKITDADIQLEILRSVKHFLIAAENKTSIVPTNVGLTDPTILSLIEKYNNELLDRNRATIGMKEGNPVMKDYDNRISSLRDNLLKGIGISESGMVLTLRELRKQENLYIGKTRGLSTQERESRELYRQKEIKETLFIYLLQKREETGLSLALATPNAKIIDRAIYDENPIKPKRMVILLTGLLFGFILPICFIYIKGLFDNKLRNKEELTRIVKAPFLGEVPVSKNKDIFPVAKVRSGIAEKFRIVGSNLSFVTGGDKHKVVLITSSVSGEGKSFFARNLALSLATSGKKTLLIDMDMRKSTMTETLELNPVKGIAMYLADTNVQIEDIIDTSGQFNPKLHIIPTKIIPPNPAELLESERLNELFKTVEKEYDYVIVDAAPIGLVSDAFRLNQFASAVIYLTRVNYTFKESLKEIQGLYHDRKLHNMTCLLNGVDPSKRYGYGQGYYGKNKYYHEEEN